MQAIHSINHASKKRGIVKYAVGDVVRISKYKAAFQKAYLPNWSTELFKITEVCNTCPVTYKLEDLRGQPIHGGFYHEEIKKTAHPGEYLIEKVLEKKGTKHLVKYLGFPDSENEWIDVKNYV